MKQPHILCDSGDLAERAIVVGDPARVARIARLLDEPKKVAQNREFVSWRGKYQGKPIAIVSTGIGGPSAAIAVEEMIRAGVKIIVRVGSAGSLLASVKVGQLVIPDSIVRGEGTTLAYCPASIPAVADFDLFQQLRQAAIAAGTPFHTGTTVSVDGLYAPNLFERKEKYGQLGVLAQEMEGSTVLLVSRLRGIKAGCVFLVVNRAGVKDIQEGILKYAEQTAARKGSLVDQETKAAQIALDALTKTNE